jgi:large subunit ribosomal protein L19
VNKIMKIIENKYLNPAHRFPEVQPGCDVDISFKIKEQDKERILHFKGLVIARDGKALSETITVRNIIDGVGVERIFPLQSPSIVDIKVLKKGRIRRAKLYYLRERVGRATKLEQEFEKKKAKETQSQAQLQQPEPKDQPIQTQNPTQSPATPNTDAQKK